jgi:hypothetical protein
MDVFLLNTYHCLFNNVYDVSETNCVSIWRKKEKVSSLPEPIRYSKPNAIARLFF